MIINKWRDFGVSDKTLSLLCRWVERRISSLVKSAYLPEETQKYIFTLGHNKHGKAIYNVFVIEGLDHIRSTAQRPFDDLDEFTFAFFSLHESDRLVILSFIDPFDEIDGRDAWKDYLTNCGYSGDCDGRLSDAIVALQHSLEQRGLVKVMKGMLKGWNEVSRCMGCSVTTAIKLTRELKLPVAVVGGEVWAVEVELSNALREHMANNLYCDLPKNGKGRVRKK